MSLLGAVTKWCFLEFTTWIRFDHKRKGPKPRAGFLSLGGLFSLPPWGCSSVLGNGGKLQKQGSRESELSGLAHLNIFTQILGFLVGYRHHVQCKIQSPAPKWLCWRIGCHLGGVGKVPALGSQKTFLSSPESKGQGTPQL